MTERLAIDGGRPASASLLPDGRQLINRPALAERLCRFRDHRLAVDANDVVAVLRKVREHDPR